MLLCCCLVTLQVSQQMVYQPQDDNDDTWISHGDIEGLGFFCQPGSESQWDGRKNPRDGVVFGGKYLPKIWKSHLESHRITGACGLYFPSFFPSRIQRPMARSVVRPVNRGDFQMIRGCLAGVFFFFSGSRSENLPKILQK